MKVDLSLSNAKIYNIFEEMDIKLGETGLLTTDSDHPVDFYAKSDAVLNIIEADTTASFVAASIGTSVIYIMDRDGDDVVKKLVINVVAAITEPATALNVSTEPPVPK